MDQPATPIKIFDYDQCIAAFRREAVPESLESATARGCVIRGIRCHYDFATSPAVTKLYNSRYPEIARARNARLIMSNVIPDELEDPKVQPYCIWNPDIALEDTYREIARRFPTMRYQVGRACAAAGYT